MIQAAGEFYARIRRSETIWNARSWPLLKPPLVPSVSMRAIATRVTAQKLEFPMPHHWWTHVGHVHRNFLLSKCRTYWMKPYNYLVLHDLWCVLHTVLMRKCHMSCMQLAVSDRLCVLHTVLLRKCHMSCMSPAVSDFVYYTQSYWRKFMCLSCDLQSVIDGVHVYTTHNHMPHLWTQ